ncbi:MAG: LicD family protein, partial [Firmicutes bacterium]|nr:LicD family protein [Bacillota bacterium]
MSDLKMLNKIQETEIEILQTIDKICHKHNLVYFGIGGTALGAVRHEGFIPWDDDIDIGMPRVDYEKFLEIAREELPSEYHIQHFTTEKKTPFYFTK